MYKIIEPIDITESMLVSVNVTEELYDEWNDTTTYSADGYVIREHRIFLCKVGHTDRDPLEESNIYDDSGDPATGYWEDKGYTAPYRMFDNKSRAVTTNADLITVSIKPGRYFNSLSLLNCKADKITVYVNDEIEGELFGRVVPMLDNSEVSGFYTWINAPVIQKTDFALTDIPGYSSSTITVILENSGEVAQVGELVVGVAKDLGITLFGYNVGLSDYSKKEVEDGVVTLEPGITSDTSSFTVKVPHYKKSYVRNVLRTNRGKGIVFIGHEDLEETITYAFLQDFDMTVENSNYAYCQIDIEELSA